MSIEKKISFLYSILKQPGILKNLFLWPKFSVTSFLMLSRLRNQGIFPNTFIDVGANVGQFAVAAAKLFPKSYVYSFEPSPETFKKLEKNVASLKNIICQQIALGERTGTVDFRINTYDLSSSILPLADGHRTAFPSIKEKAVIQVPINTLNNVSAQMNLVPPVLLKLDVQGYEASVLDGASECLSKMKYVIMESSFVPMYEGELIFSELLRKMEYMGFSFLRPVDFTLSEKNGEVAQIDALFSRTA